MYRLTRFCLAVLVLASLSGTAHGDLFSREVEPQDIVDRAQATVEAMADNPDYVAMLEYLREAQGVLIFPRVVRGAFLVGGSGGLGVFMAWDEESRDFSPAAFYSLGAVSFGVQFGGEAAEVVMIARTQDAVDSMFGSGLRLGGDASVAAGPVGAGRGATVTADFVSFDRSRGAFLGMSLEGSRLSVRDDFNEAYYGEPQRPVHIIETRRVDHPGTRELRETLADLRTSSEPLPEESGQDEPAAAGGIRPDNFEVESF